MKFSSPVSNSAAAADNATRGFTLVEVLVAIVVSSIMAMGIVIHYVAQNKAYAIQRERAHIQQNLRAAMYMLKNDIRNCGRDPMRSGRYGINTIVRFDPDDPDTILLTGYWGLSMTGLRDIDGDGIADTGTAAEQTIDYRVMDQDGDGRMELRRLDSLDTTAAPNNWQLVMDGIEDIGFAFAYDDGSGDLARSGNAVIWAIDNDNLDNDDEDLDISLDTNEDSDITIADGLNGALATPIKLARIRAARIWLLARSRHAYPDFTDNSTYVMGSHVLDLTEEDNADRRNFRHLLLTSVVALNNYEMDPGQ